MILSFDFDSTLDRKDVQLYAEKLIKEGHELWVTTARYDQPPHPGFYWTANKDLFEVTDRLGIPRERIIFCNMQPKWELMLDVGFEWHLDDDDFELGEIATNTSIKAIDVKSPRWLGICERLTK